MNRVVGVLGVLVTALAVACIALAIALVNASSTTSPIQVNQFYSNDSMYLELCYVP